jgi:hypothetical protein
MKVYIYKPDKSGFQDDWLFAADMGFKRLGAKIIYFDDIQSVPYAPDNIVVAYIEDTQYHLDRNIGYIPMPMNIPSPLTRPSFTGRRINSSVELRHVKNTVTVFNLDKIFIKPAEVTKQFPSGVIKISNLDILIPRSGGIGGAAEISGLKLITDYTRVFISEPVEIFSEYRCFVHENKLVGLKHYSGDFTEYPSNNKILNFIDRMRTWEYCPIAYTLDVAIIRSNKLETNDSPESSSRTVVMECNDAWSIGNYGLDPLTYAKMLRDRWFELTGYRTCT